jgi:hypothetical protein
MKRYEQCNMLVKANANVRSDCQWSEFSYSDFAYTRTLVNAQRGEVHCFGPECCASAAGTEVQ